MYEVNGILMSHEQPRSCHQLRVEKLLLGFGKQLPPTPRLPDRKEILCQLRMLAEEFFELCVAAGVSIELREPVTAPYDLGDARVTRVTPVLYEKLAFVNDPQATPDLPLMMDGAADVSVLNVGLMSLCGVADQPLLETVDGNNLLKIATATKDPETGKFVKHPNHPKPNFGACLAAQGWVG